MKAILILLAALAPLMSLAQSGTIYGLMPTENEKILYTEVIQAPEIKKEDLYKRAKFWIASSYKSSKDVTVYEDEKDGRIMVKGFHPNMIMSVGAAMLSTALIDQLEVQHTMIIYVKDGRYKYEMTDFRRAVPGRKDVESFPIEDIFYSGTSTAKRKFFEREHAFAVGLIESLKKGMQTANVEKDW